MSLCRRPVRRIALAAKTGSFINKTTLRSFSNQNISKPIEQIYHFNTQQPQLIGEERQDDVIFKVYLKRVQHKSSALIGSSSTIHTLVDDNNDQSETFVNTHHNDCGTLLYSTIKVYQFKAGTLEKIVEYLTNDNGDLDTTHMYILLSTYRTFTTTQILIDTLINRYRAVLPASLDMTEDIRQKALKSLRVVFICLFNEYKEDFYEPPRYSTLNHLIKHMPDRDLQKQGQTLLEQLKRDEDKTESYTDNNRHDEHSPKNDYLYNRKGLDYLTPWNILDMCSTLVAEQLTIVDAELLKRVLPYECLSTSTNGCSLRTLGNNSNRTLSTVDRTIEYFNAVVARVIATILKERNDRIRANVIEKWIDVAHQCRKLKNFSSLTAILNGLFSGCIYRLTQAWSYVNGDYRKILEDLKNVFGSCADKQQARAILEKQINEIRLALPECSEATAKYADVTIAIDASLGKKTRRKVTRDQEKQTMVGTVPYLGLYLSDLTYIDSAYPKLVSNENEKDLSATSLTSSLHSTGSTKHIINFEKHRKEFEILAQIKLFQSAVNAYTTLHSLPRFKAWFDTVRIYNDTESWDLSYQIEPKEITDNCQPQERPLRTGLPKTTIRRFPSEISLDSLGTVNNHHHPNGSTTGVGSSIPSSPSLNSLDKISTTSNHSLRAHQLPHPQSGTGKPPYINHSRSSSASSVLTSSNGSSSLGYGSATTSPTASAGNCTLNANENETIIAKIQFAGKDELLYKKVRITNNERTTSVLKTILDKFGFDPATYDRYCIEQQLPGRKILILDHCNVFYALARSSDDEQVDLVVREKTRQEREQKSPSLMSSAGHNRTPSGLSTSSTHSR